MALLRTPSHQCQQIINTVSGRIRCHHPAHKRVNGKFYCRTDARRHRLHTRCLSCQ